jgi:lactoylglutathione lyase
MAKAKLKIQKGTKTTPHYDPRRDVHQTLSHIGLVVADIIATQARMDAFGLNNIKRVGDKTDPNSVIPAAYGLTDPKKIAAAELGVELMGFDFLLIIADPDGNLIEIQPQ